MGRIGSARQSFGRDVGERHHDEFTDAVLEALSPVAACS